MLYNTKVIHLQRVFHGIRFKVNNEDWLSVIDSLFLCPFGSVASITNDTSALKAGTICRKI